MKTFTTLCFCLFLFLSGKAQKTAAIEYLNKTPAIPDNVCAGKPDSLFLEKIYNLTETIRHDIEARKHNENKQVEEQNPAMKKRLAKQAGLTDADATKLQDENTSDKEKEAIANKAMTKKTGISMDELKNLDNMSDEAVQAWAQGMMTEQMAVAQANAKANKGAQPNTDPNNAKSTYALVQQMNELAMKLGKMDSELKQEFDQMTREGDAALKKLEEQTGPLKKEWWSLVGAGNEKSGARQEKIYSQVRGLEKQFCAAHSPVLIAFIKKTREKIVSSFPDCDNVDKLSRDVAASSPATVKSSGYSSYTGALEALQKYLGYLKEAYRYCPCFKPI
jgi:hypothetical protein